MASPHVAGLAALLLEQHPTWTVADVINRIKNTGTPAASLAGKTVTGKIINAAAALQDGTQPTMTHVDLGDWVNRQAFIQDGQPFSNTIGVELSGTTSRALSANQLGDPVVWPGVTTFDLESATANNAVAGQRIITLPAGNYDKLHFLATTGWDSFATGLSVTVTYADGSTTFPQGFSKWTATSTEPGETVVSTMTYSNVSNGTQNNAQVRVYGYTLTLDPTKQVVSFTTPNQGKVVVLGITLESAGSSAPSPVQVSLSGSYNRVGITANGSPFTGGLDNNGNAYSSTALTSTASWNGLNFALPTTSGNNVVSAAGQVIALPTGNYSALSFLATAVNANQLNQAFTVRYTDNSTQTFTQSLSSWTATQNVANEETAKVMTSRNTAAGGQDNTTVRLYGYSIVLNGAKRVQNIQLPNNGNVELLAITLTPSAPSPTMVSLTGSYNQVGIVNGAYTTTGLDENNRSYQYAGFFGGNDNPQYQGFLPWSGQAFPYTWAGANNTVNNVAYTHGQTITFPTGTYSGLSFLASAVNTDQLNQVFTVNYVGGSTRTFTQSLSNWLNPGTSQLYPNEARAVTLIKYVPPSGVAVNQNNYIYGYSIPLDGSKSVASITLPNNSNVKLIAINLTPASLPPSNPPQPAQQQVSLTYDRIGFVNDNQTFANNQGIDANGRALSANLLNASPISWSGATFNLGPATGNNVTYAHGQTVSFTAGNYSHLYFLATTSWDSYPAQTFTVNYATGAPVPVNLSFSIWTAPQSYTGEEQVLPMAYRNLSTGARDNTAVYLYGYTITIDPTRQVTSITLPNQGKINILAMTLV